MDFPNIEMHLKCLDVPPYTHGRYGDWSLSPCQDPEVEAVQGWGYVTGPQWEQPYPQLVDVDGRVWMSANRLERESQATHVASAHGTVVVCGVGLGLYLHNVARKPEVTKVYAVDVDATVIAMVRQNAEEHHWPGFHKVEFLRGDARELTRDHLHSRSGLFTTIPDYVYVDIWPTLMHADTLADFRTIVGNLNPDGAGFWGQELSFMDWAVNDRRPPVEPYDQVSLSNFDEWCLWTEAVMETRSLDYLRYCLVCWVNQKGRNEARDMAEEARRG